MPQHMSQAVQDYVKAVYLETEVDEGGSEGSAATTAVAGRLGVSAASATNMLKRLDTLGLVDLVPYRGAELTDAGRKVALEVIRHHRLLETYLAEALGVPWDEVHAEAEVLEHVLSERLEDRIAERLGDPTSDPHGHPIPPRSGDVVSPERVPLAGLEAGSRAIVAEVSDRDPALLRYLGEAGLFPGALVRATSVEPFEGPLTLEIGHSTRVLGREAASHVLVTPVTDKGVR